MENKNRFGQWLVHIHLKAPPLTEQDKEAQQSRGTEESGLREQQKRLWAWPGLAATGRGLHLTTPQLLAHKGVQLLLGMEGRQRNEREGRE